MKKTLIASALAMTTLGSVNAQADIAITNMLFGTTDYASGGSLTDAGDGAMFSVDDFFYHTWTGGQATTFMDNTGSWSGSSAQGAYDYDADIAGMSAGQVAVGIMFNWNGQNEIAVLEIFDCAANFCQGNGVSMANGPFAGSVAIFSGTGSANVPEVPVPAAVWLMGSGLLGLVGVARRRKQA